MVNDIIFGSNRPIDKGFAELAEFIYRNGGMVEIRGKHGTEDEVVTSLPADLSHETVHGLEPKGANMDYVVRSEYMDEFPKLQVTGLASLNAMKKIANARKQAYRFAYQEPIRQALVKINEPEAAARVKPKVIGVSLKYIH